MPTPPILDNKDPAAPSVFAPAALLRQPLIRLLAVNLLGGVAVALLMLGGLMLINPGGLRDLVQADRDPAAALALLAFGLVITFGSAAMGSAVMALGPRRRTRDGGGKTRPVRGKRAALAAALRRR